MGVFSRRQGAGCGEGRTVGRLFLAATGSLPFTYNPLHQTHHTLFHSIAKRTRNPCSVKMQYIVDNYRLIEELFQYCLDSFRTSYVKNMSPTVSEAWSKQQNRFVVWGNGVCVTGGQLDRLLRGTHEQELRESVMMALAAMACRFPSGRINFGFGGKIETNSTTWARYRDWESISRPGIHPESRSGP